MSDNVGVGGAWVITWDHEVRGFVGESRSLGSLHRLGDELGFTKKGTLGLRARLASWMFLRRSNRLSLVLMAISRGLSRFGCSSDWFFLPLGQVSGTIGGHFLLLSLSLSLIEESVVCEW